MSILRKILIPFSWLYSFVLGTRNIFYDKEILRSTSYMFPVICVGNLSMGGTGKTPMIEYILRLLLPTHKTATLSRGYGRKSKCFILLKGTENAKYTGDEPLQFKQKFPEAIVAVDENRQNGILNLQSLCAPEVVLLDDAFQHRKVKAGYNILLTSYGKLYSEDFVLPAGNLRESPTGASRANIVVVTKCPENLSKLEQKKIGNSLNLQPNQDLFFSYIHYGRNLIGDNAVIPITDLSNKKITLVTGIANPQPLCDFLENQVVGFEHLKFPDHHNFSEKELEKISKAPIVITTEKDYMRLKDLISHLALYYLPIELQFVNDHDKQKFDGLIKKFIQKEK